MRDASYLYPRLMRRLKCRDDSLALDQEIRGVAIEFYKDFLLVDKTKILDLSMVFKIAAAFVSLSTLSFAATTIKQPTICANGQVVSHEAVSLI